MTCKKLKYLLPVFCLLALAGCRQPLERIPFEREYTAGMDLYLKEGLVINGEKKYIRAVNYRAQFPGDPGQLPPNAYLRDLVRIKNGGFDAVRIPYQKLAPAIGKACYRLDILIIPVFDCRKEDHQAGVLECSRMIRDLPGEEFPLFYADYRFSLDCDTSGWVSALRDVWEADSLIQYTGSNLHHDFFDVYSPELEEETAGLLPSDPEKPVFVGSYGPCQAAPVSDREAQWMQVRRYIRAENRNRRHQILGSAAHSFTDRKVDGSGTMGITGLYRRPKYAWHFFRSQRPPSAIIPPPAGAGPVVYAVSDWQEGARLTIPVFTNTSRVSVFVNERLQVTHVPVRTADNRFLSYPPVAFALDCFEPGLLWTVGYMSHRPVAFHEVFTAGNPDYLYVSPDLQGVPVASGSSDLFFVHALLVDEQGVELPDDNTYVQFEVSGPAEIVVPDTLPAARQTVLTRFGKASILLRTTGLSGQVVVSAHSPGLKNDTAVIHR